VGERTAAVQREDAQQRNSGNPGSGFCSGVLGVGKARVDSKGSGRASCLGGAGCVCCVQRDERLMRGPRSSSRKSLTGGAVDSGSSRAEKTEDTRSRSDGGFTSNEHTAAVDRNSKVDCLLRAGRSEY